MRVYVDSSALVKRIAEEEGSSALRTSLSGYAADGVAMVSSSVAWVEVSRALRRYQAVEPGADVDDLADAALSGILEKPVSAADIALARRLGPSNLRSLDAIHLAAALLIDADLLIAYDARLLEGARSQRLKVASPAG